MGAMQETLNAAQFNQLRDFRNFLAHRGTPAPYALRQHNRPGYTLSHSEQPSRPGFGMALQP